MELEFYCLLWTRGHNTYTHPPISIDNPPLPLPAAKLLLPLSLFTCSFVGVTHPCSKTRMHRSAGQWHHQMRRPLLLAELMQGVSSMVKLELVREPSMLLCCHHVIGCCRCSCQRHRLPHPPSLPGKSSTFYDRV